MDSFTERLPRLSMTGNNNKAECSPYRALPSLYMTAFHKHALAGHKRKNGLASELDPRASRVLDSSPLKRQWIGSMTDHHDTCVLHNKVNWILYLPPNEVYVWRTCSLSTCSKYGNLQLQLPCITSQEATATFLLLPNWMENSTNACHNTCTSNKDVRTILGNVPRKKVRNIPLPAKQNTTPAC